MISSALNTGAGQAEWTDETSFAYSLAAAVDHDEDEKFADSFSSLLLPFPSIQGEISEKSSPYCANCKKSGLQLQYLQKLPQISQ